MPGRLQEFIENVASATGIALLWARRAWIATQVLIALRRAWGLFKRRKVETKENGMGKLGIANLLIMCSVMASLGNLAGKSMQDGKIDGKDLALLPDAVMIFPKAIQTDWSQLIPEAKDLDAAEGDELLAHFKKEFDIPQDDLELKIEDVLSILKDSANLVMRLIAIWQTKKVPALAA